MPADTFATHAACARSVWRRVPVLVAAAIAAIVLSACGGSPAHDGREGPLACSEPARQSWLGAYMNDAYYWYRLIPTVDPAAYPTTEDYFYALLSPGGTVDGVTFPADRWSFSEPTSDYRLFFGQGQILGYGLAVAALELDRNGALPLRVRYVEPLSPGATAGLKRGDTVLEINGLPASQYVENDDFSVLTASAEGQIVVVRWRDGQGVERVQSIAAAVYTLTPLASSSLVRTPSGRQMGYVLLKDFVDPEPSKPLSTSLANAFAQFKTQGITEVVLDLRYNTGGLVSAARDVASYVAGPGRTQQDFARLLFNDRLAASWNQAWQFSDFTFALAASRVYVLTGLRTCSASELLINGLEPYVEVVVIGDTTCGKPVGFVPESDGCGTTFNAVNFEVTNALNQGRYWFGLTPNAGCALADDLDHALGDPAEALLAAALRHTDSGQCTATAAVREQPMVRTARPLRRIGEGERPGGLIGR
jgi:carboxyl-terminal processing protease